MEQNRDVYAVPGNVTNKNAWGPNTLIKQGAKLTATWEDVWEDLPSQVRLHWRMSWWRPGDGMNRKPEGPHLYLAIRQLPEHERMVFDRLRQDESMQLDELIEQLEAELGSAEIFTALFELELAGRVRQLPGKNYVRAF